ncbi:KipI antagonist [compost metagenome]
MHIEILKPGLLTTIQDRGRLGYRHIGMPTAGCMDEFAASTANILVGNEAYLPVLELTYGGVELMAHSDLLIACCGGGASLIAKGKELPFWKPLFIPSGTKLKFVTNDSGVRQYLAVVGGWSCKEVLNSRSTYLPTHTGGHEGRALRTGDTLHSNQDISLLSGTMLLALSNDQAIAYPKWSVNPLQFVNYQTKSIRFMPGHEYEWFNKDTQLKFENSNFNLSQQSNRMGCYFDGPLLKTKVARALRSTAVSSGTLQVTNSGKIVLLMADSQTTGGYPRIAQLAAVDLPICAQLRPGESIRFEKIDIDQADELLSNRLRHMDSLKDIVKSHFL